MIDEGKYQSSHFCCKDHHDNNEELQRERRDWIGLENRSKSSKSQILKNLTQMIKHCPFFTFLLHSLTRTFSVTNTDAYQSEAKFGLTKCGTASHQTKDQHHHAYADDGDCWDQHLLVLNEAFKGVIALNDPGSNPSQHTAGGLQRRRETAW